MKGMNIDIEALARELHRRYADEEERLVLGWERSNQRAWRNEAESLLAWLSRSATEGE